jgi:hypothetical protein
MFKNFMEEIDGCSKKEDIKSEISFKKNALEGMSRGYNKMS